MAKVAVDPVYQQWVENFALYERDFQKWEKRVQNILKIYRRETNGIVRQTPAKFNILWSNVQTLVPAVFAKIPTADVSRRFKDNDPVGRVASQILERALNYDLETNPDFRTTLRQNVYDRFLGGRGTSWIRYEPHFQDMPMPEGLEVSSETEDPETIEVLKEEYCPIDYVHWRDFGCTVGRTWEEVTGVWRRVYMTREAMIERFGEKLGKKIPLDAKPPDLRTNRPYGSDSMDARGLIYEIWDKETNKAIWISKSLGEILDERDDPLGLPGFFPCPKPLFATMTSDSIVPIPDYVLYEDQARSLDTLAERISGLIEALKVRGVYNAEYSVLSRLFSEGENNALIPVDNWMAFAEKQGLKGAIDLVDITIFGNALEQAYQAFEQVKQQIYEIIGLSDIMRGVSQAEETLGAQQLKAHFGGNRLTDYQNQVAEYASAILKLKAHVMCTKFSEQSLMEMGDVQELSIEDQQLVPQALQLLKNEPLRSFRIDIEADSMVQIDEAEDKQSRLEFLGALGGFLKETSQAIGGNPQLAPLVTSMVEFGARGFKIGKTLEGEIDSLMDKMKQQAANPPPQPPNPDVMKLQMEGQNKQQEMQMNAQLQQAQMQQEAQFKEKEVQLEVWKAQQVQAAQERQAAQQNQLEAARAQLEAQHEERLKMMDMENQKRMAEVQNHVTLLEAMIKAQTSIEVAEVGAQASLSKEQAGAAEGASHDVRSLLHLPDMLSKINDSQQQLAEHVGKITQDHQKLAGKVQDLSKPKKKTVVRGNDGKISHVIEESM